MKIGLIGCGAYGIAMAEMLHKNSKDIIMWTENEKKIKEYENKQKELDRLNAETEIQMKKLGKQKKQFDEESLSIDESKFW